MWIFEEKFRRRIKLKTMPRHTNTSLIFRFVRKTLTQASKEYLYHHIQNHEKKY